MRFCIHGCNGRMGKELVRIIEESEDSKVICGIDQEIKNNTPFPIYTKTQDVKETPDVIIDFSVPEATMKVLEYAKNTKTPLVIATTGLSEEQLKYIEECSKEIPIFQSANMSYDICLFRKLLKIITPFLGEDYDIEIIESHHNKKIDSPSGTAIALANAINEVSNGKYFYNFDRMKERKARDKNEIGFSSIRGGNIVGEHIVAFHGPYESFEIKHSSYSRNVFASGALKAAQFIVNQENNLYTMDDLFKDIEL